MRLLGVPGEHQRNVWISNARGELYVAVAPVTAELDLAVNDEVEFCIDRTWYHYGFMEGAQLTLRRGEELIFVVNEELAAFEQAVGPFEFAAGDDLCVEAPDDFSCSKAWRALEVSLGDESLTLEPYSQGVLGDYSVVLNQSLGVHDGGGCDVGDSVDFGIFRTR